MILTAWMAHQRKLIRDAVVALLVAAATSAGVRVSSTRVDPHKASALPAISVYTLSETADAQETAPRWLTRVLQIEVTAWIADSTALPIDDAMDAMALQIEAAMDANRWISGLVMESVLANTEMQVVEDDGRSDPLVGIVTLTYVATYRSSPALASAVDDFKTADTRYLPAGGVADTAPAEDSINVQEIP